MNPFVAFVEKGIFPAGSLRNTAGFPAAAAGGRGHSGTLPEHPAEIARVVIAAGLGDFGNGVAGIQQHLAGVGNPHLIQVIGEGLSEHPAEFGGKIAVAEIADFQCLFHQVFLLIMVGKVLEQPVEPLLFPGGETGGVYR